MRLRDHVARVLAIREADQHVPPRAGYVIFSGPYLSNSAGVYCLHKLCDELNRRGIPSFTTGGGTAAPHLNAPVVDVDSAAALCARGFIAVYGETVRGNPLGANSVVRWVLNRPGLLGGDQVYSGSELVFSYSNVYTPYIKNRVVGKLHMPTIDQTLFYCDDPEVSARSLACYYVGKSTWKKGVCDPKNTFEITRLSPEKKELGKLLRASKVLYCFDNSTILIYEALLCGCPVVVIPDGTQTKADYELLELGPDGIAWGLEEFDERPVDVAGLKNRVRVTHEQFVSQLEQMIELSQARVERNVDWQPEAFNTLGWRLQPRQAVAISARRIKRTARALERSIRLWRKRQVKRGREWLSTRLRSSGACHFYGTEGSFLNRRLECYWSHGERASTDVFDEKETIRITSSLSASQLGNLFRASRRFYAFGERNKFVEYALTCGCPVTLISDSGETHHVLPRGSDMSQSATSCTGPDRGRIAS